MPHKLIRLTCESNDGVFNGIFDQDIEIKKDSEIALKSVTLERAASSIEISSALSEIRHFNSVGLAEDDPISQISQIYKTSYTSDDTANLMQEITVALNRDSGMYYPAEQAQMNVQWNASINPLTDRVEIGARTSPFFPMVINPTTSNNNSYRLSCMEFNKAVQNNVDGADSIITDTSTIGTYRDDGNHGYTPSPYKFNDCYMYSTEPFIKSAGSLRVRLASMTESGQQDPAFTICITNAQGLLKLNDATFTLTDFIYAIRIKQPYASAVDATYTHTWQEDPESMDWEEFPAGPMFPNNYGASTIDDNDVIEIIREAGYLQGIIHQSGGSHPGKSRGKRFFLTEGTLLDDLYPCVFFHQQTTNAKAYMLDYMKVSLDPWTSLAPDIRDNNPEIYIPTSNIGFELYDYDYRGPKFTPSLKLKRGLALYLGYTEAQLALWSNNPEISTSPGGILTMLPKINLYSTLQNSGYSTTQGFIIAAPFAMGFAIEGDTLLIESQTFSLNTYDSYGLSTNQRNANSGGGRRNILAGVPVIERELPDSTNTLVYYEPNTMNYIAIRNNKDITVRQINMRLVDSRYRPIVTAGIAQLFIIIRDSL